MKLRWGIIGAGHIAKDLADGVIESDTGALLAVASRDQAKADVFGDTYIVPRRYGSYQALLDDPDVDAVYIAVPHPMHVEWAIKGAEAKKHLLVEKPIGMNRFETMAILEAARVNDVFLMEAFMYRCHPQTFKLRDMISSGLIGEVQHIRASFAYDATPGGLVGRAFENDLGGGGILDVGCYPASAARMIAGAATGLPFAEPIDVKGVGHVGPTGADHYAIASLRFAGDITAEISTGVGLHMHHDQTIKIYGTKGTIFVPDPWCPSRYDRNPVKIIVRMHDEKADQTVMVEAPKDLYSYEADMVGEHIAARQAPAMPWADTLGNMTVLDRWRAEVGVVYDLEARFTSTTFAGRRLAKKPSATMRYGSIAGLDKPLSRLIFGCDSNNTVPDTSALLDDYFERGGNTFDTSYGYGNPNGANERNLGAWIAARGIRDQVVVIEKGANYPNDSPDGLTRELLGGLERLGMDSVDMWMIHRDNQQVPMGEWMDALNQHWRAGRMKLFGFSNITLPRLIAAQEYAARHGLQPISALSNNFALARMLDPVWPGCESASDPAYRDWLTKSQLPLLPWSSQARGFFTGRASRDYHGSEEFNRCWYSEDNFARKERANELAAKRGVEPINIALAYVLNQPFPTFPLIGPKQISETVSCTKALEIELTPEELRWLENGAASDPID